MFANGKTKKDNDFKRTVMFDRPFKLRMFNCEAKTGLDMWSHFLENYSGKSVLLREIWSSS